MKYGFPVMGLMGALLLASCNQPNPAPVPVSTVNLNGVVSVGRAGAAIEGATVSLVGTDRKATTDADGRFTLAVPTSESDSADVLITKEGYAATRVENLRVTATQNNIEEILQRSFDPNLPSIPPTVTVDLQDGATVGGADLEIKVTTTTASPDLNGPTTGIVAFEVPAGSSGFLNAGRTRVAQFALDGDDTFKIPAASLSAYRGDVDVHVSVYDFNGNRTRIVRRVKVSNAATDATVIAPSNVAPSAVTFASTATFGALSKVPDVAAGLKAFANGDRTALNRLAATPGVVPGTNDVTPQAAPDETVMWVDVNFNYPPTSPAPRAFELLRSFDGATYEKVLTVRPASVKIAPAQGQPDTGAYVIRDTSSRLTPGVKTYYKVRAVGANTADSADVNVTPLDRYRVELISPTQGATGVDRTPIFRWKTQGGSDVEVASIILFDRTQAEGSSVQWQSDDIVGEQAAPYNVDGRARTAALQPLHAYDWQLAAITFNEDQTAFSIGADFFNVYGVTGFPVEAGPVHEFITGGI